MTDKKKRESRAISLARRSFEKVGLEVEQSYQADRALAAERLHNLFVDAIREESASIETVLYVLEMIKASVIHHAQVMVFSAGAPAEVSVSQTLEPVEFGTEKSKDDLEAITP